MVPGSRGFAIFMLVVATAAWGLSFPAGKALLMALETRLPERPSWFFAALVIAARFGLGALLLAIAQPTFFARVTRSEVRQGFLLGVTAGLGTMLQTDALAYTHASTVAFLTSFTCVLIPLCVMVRTRRPPALLVILCLALVLPGVAVLSRFDWHTLRFGRGEVETLIGSGFFTAQIFAVGHSAFRGNDAQRLTLVMFVVMALVLAPIVLWESHHAADLLALTASAPTFYVFLSTTLICSIAAFLLMNRWQRHVDATTAGIIYALEPLFATLFALYLPSLLAGYLRVGYRNETLTWHLLIGGGLITVANLLIAFRSEHAPAPKRVDQGSPASAGPSVP